MRRLVADDVFLLAGSIAYVGLLSLFPLLVGLVVLLSAFVRPAQAQEAVIAALTPYLPADALTLVRESLQAVLRTRGAAGTVAVIGLFWTASAVAGALRHALNRVIRAPARSFWWRKLIELAMVALAGVFLSLSLLVSLLVKAAGSVRPLVEAGNLIQNSPAAGAAAAIAPFVLSAAGFWVVYRFLPHRRLHWRNVLIASAAALILFEVSKQAFFWYVSTLADYPLVYGPMAGLVVLMVWAYLIAVVVLVGGEVIAVLETPPPEQRHG